MRPGVLLAARLATGCPDPHGSPSRERDPWTGNADWRHGLAGDAYLRAGMSPINASPPPPTHFCSHSVTARPPQTASMQDIVLSAQTPPLSLPECSQRQPSSSGRSSQQFLTPGFTCSTPMEAVRQRLVSAHARGDLRSLRAASQALLQLQAHEEQAMRAEHAHLSEYVAQLELSVAVRDDELWQLRRRAAESEATLARLGDEAAEAQGRSARELAEAQQCNTVQAQAQQQQQAQAQARAAQAQAQAQAQLEEASGAAAARLKQLGARLQAEQEQCSACVQSALHAAAEQSQAAEVAGVEAAQLRAQLITTRSELATTRSVGIAAAEEAAAQRVTARSLAERRRQAERTLEEAHAQLEEAQAQLEEARPELQGRAEAATTLALRAQAQLAVETERRTAAETQLELLGAARREQEVALLTMVLGCTYHGPTHTGSSHSGKAF